MTKHRGGLSPDKYLTDEQLRKLRQYVKDQADLARVRGSSRAVIDELIVEIVVNSGLRAQELCDLTIADTPFNHGKDVLWVQNGKGGKSREVPIPSHLSKRIKNFVRSRRTNANQNETLLANYEGAPLHYRTLYEKIRRLTKQAGCGAKHPHVLRHTYAMRLYALERDLRLVQRLLGHARSTTTEIYADTNPEDARRQIEGLD